MLGEVEDGYGYLKVAIKVQGLVFAISSGPERIESLTVYRDNTEENRFSRFVFTGPISTSVPSTIVGPIDALVDTAILDTPPRLPCKLES